MRNKFDLNALGYDFDYIFNFAAQLGILQSSTFEDYFSNNVIGKQNLLEFALQNKNLIQFGNIATSLIYSLEATFE